MDTKAAFEKWFEPKKIAMQSRGISTIRIVRLYRCQWEAWQASRAAIEIDISPENVEALVTTCQHLIEREGYSEHSANLRLIAKLALPMLTSHGIRIKGKTE